MVAIVLVVTMAGRTFTLAPGQVAFRLAVGLAVLLAASGSVFLTSETRRPSTTPWPNDLLNTPSAGRRPTWLVDWAPPQQRLHRVSAALADVELHRPGLEAVVDVNGSVTAPPGETPGNIAEDRAAISSGALPPAAVRCAPSGAR